MPADRIRKRDHGFLIPEKFVTVFEGARDYIGNPKHIRKAGQGRKCVDGRYTPEQSLGAIATPGCDFGYVLTLMALKPEMTAHQAFDSVYNIVTRDGGKFYMHTDDLGHGPIGCGHVAKATSPEHAPSYGLNSDRVMEALIYARKKIDAGDANIVQMELKGTHLEKAVLRVQSEDYTIESSDGQEMYFIYDELRDKTNMRRLAKELGVSVSEFIKHHDKQTLAILHILARGKPIIDVSILEEGESIKAELINIAKIQ